MVSRDAVAAIDFANRVSGTEAAKDFTVVGLTTASSVTVTTAWVPSTTLSEPLSAVTSDDAGYVGREKYLNG